MTDAEPPLVLEVDELHALQRALQRAQGFALYVARVNSPGLRERIQEWLAQNVARPFQDVKLTAGQPISEQIAASAAHAGADAVLSVYGLEELTSAEEADWLRHQLNWRRASFQKIERPLLLWLPEHLLTLLMESAPDFFDWHSGFYEFSLPGQEAQRELQSAMSAAWDGPMLARTPAERAGRIAILKGLLDEYMQENQERAAQARILNTLGGLYREAGDARKAIVYYEQALTIYREIGNKRGEGANLGNLGIAYSNLGEPRRAIEFHEQALSINREIGNKRGEGINLGNLGIAYTNLDEVRRAIEFHEQSLSIAREIGNRYSEGNILGNLGGAYQKLGEPRRAMEYYEQSLVIFQEIGNKYGEGGSIHNLGLVYADLGEPRRAVEYYEQALTIAREIGNKDLESNICWSMGLLLEKQGHYPRAIELMQVRVDYRRAIGHPDAKKDAQRVAQIDKDGRKIEQAHHEIYGKYQALIDLAALVVAGKAEKAQLESMLDSLAKNPQKRDVVEAIQAIVYQGARVEKRLIPLLENKEDVLLVRDILRRIK